MKIKAMQRSGANTVERECIGDLRQQARNLNPVYHPMQRAREYTRAVTAAKMDRMFAKPLIAGNFEDGHRDAVLTSAISRRSLVPFVSGAADGSVKLWDMTSRKTVANLETAHTRQVTGLTFSTSGQQFYSCSDDGYIHQWSIHRAAQKGNSDDDLKPAALDTATDVGDDNQDYRKNRRRKPSPAGALPSSSSDYGGSASSHGPLNSWRTAGSFKSIDHHWMEPDTFATASDEAVQIWSCHRSSALSTFKDLWSSSDTVTVVRYNPAEKNLLANCSADRGIGLHDTRTSTSLKKTVLRMNSNDLQWNPMEPMNFVVANEDFNAYTFDMRNLSQPTRIYKGHTGAVLSVAWSPTGREFVTGSYDKTIRIFNVNNGGQSRDIYHTKRMQRVFTVQYSSDDKFIVSGSDDTNVRLWKAHASEQLGQTTIREESAQSYRQALIQRYQHLPEVKKIYRSRKIPSAIRKQTHQSIIMKESAERKLANRVKYDKTGTHKFISERKKIVVKEIE
jgi:DDB1- and CUL4-associated factor 13